jgi:hypothetical protein
LQTEESVSDRRYNGKKIRENLSRLVGTLLARDEDHMQMTTPADLPGLGKKYGLKIKDESRKLFIF